MLQDFSYFSQVVPGCYVQIGGWTEATVCSSCHQAGYDYNDDITPIAMAVWVKLAEARFGATLYPEPEFFPKLPDVPASAIERFVAAMRG